MTKNRNHFDAFEKYKKHVDMLKALTVKKYDDIIRLIKSPYSIAFEFLSLPNNNNGVFTILPEHTWADIQRIIETKLKGFDKMECNICLELIEQRVTCSKCGMSSCSKCYTKNMKNNNFKCSYCRFNSRECINRMREVFEGWTEYNDEATHLYNHNMFKVLKFYNSIGINEPDGEFVHSLVLQSVMKELDLNADDYMVAVAVADADDKSKLNNNL